MTVLIASDHAGFALKKHFVEYLKDIQWIDLGCPDENSVDYPDYAAKLTQALVEKGTPAPGSLENPPFGILICGSGQGMAIKANRNPHVRAALCWNEDTARLARAHNNANILCLGGRMIDFAVAEKILRVFLSTPFEGGRHAGRVQKLSQQFC